MHAALLAAARGLTANARRCPASLAPLPRAHRQRPSPLGPPAPLPRPTRYDITSDEHIDRDEFTAGLARLGLNLTSPESLGLSASNVASLLDFVFSGPDPLQSVTAVRGSALCGKRGMGQGTLAE